MKYAIGIDLGGTDLKTVVVDERGEILDRHLTPSTFVSQTDTEAPPSIPYAFFGYPTPESIWQVMVRQAVPYYEQTQGVPAAAIGVAAPGLVAPDGRSIATMPGRLVGLEGLDWTTFLKRKKMVPVLNDAHAALFGEAWRGAAAGPSGRTTRRSTG